MTEEKMQCAVVKMLRYRRLDCLFFHIPNGSKRSGKRGNILKAMGMNPGAADLAFVKDGRAYFIELKAESGDQNQEQIDFEADCKRHKAPYIVIKTSDQNEMNAKVLGTLKAWGIA